MGGYWPKLILSFLGIDGYTFYLSDNYTLIGEWFFGAIVIIYVLYPLICYLFHKYKIATMSLLFVVYITIVLFNPFKMVAYRNISTCLWSFWLGMILEENSEILKQHKVGLASIIVTCIIIFVHFPIPGEITLVIGGVTFFISIFYIATFFGDYKNIQIPSILYKAAFMVYLVHHQIIYRIVNLVNNVLFEKIAWAEILCFSCIVYAIGCLYYFIYKWILKFFAGRNDKVRI